MKKLFSCSVFIFLIALISSCFPTGGNNVKLPDFPSASPDSDSWTQWKSYDDNIIDVHWYVDNASFAYNTSTEIAKKIKEITGINIIFETPSTADGSKLSSMISGNKLPDLVTVAANTPDRIQLAEDGGYLFSITDLAQKWAPSLLTRLNEEMVSYYTASDGKLYGIPSLFYATDELNEMLEMGYSVTSNGAIVARKDMLDAYHAHRYEQDSNFDPESVATPEGIFEMAKWVKSEYKLDASNPTVLLSPFESHRTHGSVGLRWLMEYFSVPQEDENGKYVYQWDTPEFKDMMLWLNKLYTNQLMTTGNMTATSSQIGGYIQNGYPFIFIGSPQDYAVNFKNWSINNPKGDDARYVPIIFKNSDGKVPQLSITGNSYMFTMVSSNCKRPDRVIKLLDFLYSDEGQRLMYFGLEASGPDDNKGTYYFVKDPGTTITLENGKEYTYRYGQIEYTNKVIDELNNLQASGYGFYGPSIMSRGAYPYIAGARGGIFYTYTNYVNYNLKAAIKPYTYIYRGFEFELDPTDKEYLEIVNIENNLRLLWMEYYAEIICAKSASIAESIIDDTLSTAKRRGLERLVSYKDKSFQKHKEKYGIEFAWPINDKTSSYHSLTIDSVYGDPSLELEIPGYIIRK